MAFPEHRSHARGHFPNFYFFSLPLLFTGNPNDDEDDAPINRRWIAIQKGGGRMLFRKKERGQGLVEYSLLILLIALVVIVALTVFGEEISSTFSKIVNNVAWLNH